MQFSKTCSFAAVSVALAAASSFPRCNAARPAPAAVPAAAVAVTIPEAYASRAVEFVAEMENLTVQPDRREKVMAICHPLFGQTGVVASAHEGRRRLDAPCRTKLPTSRWRATKSGPPAWFARTMTSHNH